MTVAPRQPEAVDELLRWVGSRTGLTFGAQRTASAEEVVRRAMSRRGLADLAAYRRRLADDAAVFDDLVSELTIGETYFFREPAHFELVSRVVLPELRARRGPDHRLRCWSAGCSSGEEPYSLAILFGEHGLLDRVHLVGTDISRASLARALAATYRDWSFRGEGAARALRHFVRSGDGLVLDASIRGRVSFEYLNLALDTYPSFANGIWGIDLIFCRNVLIYFDRATIRGVAQRLHAALAEGGWLVTASSDPPLATEAPFETAATEWGVFYRRLPPAVAPASPAPRAWVRREAVAPPARPAGPAERRRAPVPFPTLPSAGRTASAPAGPALEAARGAFARGDYAAVVELTAAATRDAEAAALHLRALANLDPERAVEAAAAAVRRHELSPEIHYLHAALLTELDRTREAVDGMRRVIYLDRSLAIAHFSLGTLLQRSGDLEGASRAFRNARDLCAPLAPETPLPLSDGEQAGRVAEAAEAHLAVIERSGGGAGRSERGRVR